MTELKSSSTALKHILVASCVPRRGRGRIARSRRGWLNVLIEAEDVVGIVLGFDLRQALVFLRPERGALKSSARMRSATPEQRAISAGRRSIIPL